MKAEIIIYDCNARWYNTMAKSVDEYATTYLMYGKTHIITNSEKAVGEITSMCAEHMIRCATKIIEERITIKDVKQGYKLYEKLKQINQLQNKTLNELREIMGFREDSSEKRLG